MNADRIVVAQLSRRVAHATHALMYASSELKMPATAAEICLYDGEALSVRSTGAALREARKLGLAIFTGKYWTPTFAALDQRRAFEDRYLRETDTAEASS